jgi:hypothetical protein
VPPSAVHRPAVGPGRHDRGRGEAVRPQCPGRNPPRDAGRPRGEKGEAQGVDVETKGILGAVILGVIGDEVIHSLLDVMYA